jgi:hypothetical protein
MNNQNVILMVKTVIHGLLEYRALIYILCPGRLPLFDVLSMRSPLFTLTQQPKGSTLRVYGVAFNLFLA